MFSANLKLFASNLHCCKLIEQVTLCNNTTALPASIYFCQYGVVLHKYIMDAYYVFAFHERLYIYIKYRITGTMYLLCDKCMPSICLLK